MQVLRLRRSHKANGFAQDDTFLGFTDYATANANANATANAMANAGILRCAQNDDFRGKALRMTASGKSDQNDNFGSGRASFAARRLFGG
jgi:hypothetical protein